SAVRHPRSIPTCVGLTTGAALYHPGTPVHPHVRGAHVVRHGRAAETGRSIPTCVGLTLRASRASPSRAVHPHVRGAHWLRARGSRTVGGPSPRAWGSLARRARQVAKHRSIPTCVGLTRSSSDRPTLGTVHPHVRGAHGGHRRRR